ncbi:hypothetical protein [Ornithinibacillus contaminans]|uniref:hypothetical protein n=1 Tax=Ornithinibacillus contaminans TaxID=694055 RepID=UPI00064DB989|nr:hypothetical protein [Ornithinibacillus contaminans]
MTADLRKKYMKNLLYSIIPFILIIYFLINAFESPSVLYKIVAITCTVLGATHIIKNLIFYLKSK